MTDTRPPSDSELREWRSLRSLAQPGPETLRTVYRGAFPVLLDEFDKAQKNREALAQIVREQAIEGDYVDTDTDAAVVLQIVNRLTWAAVELSVWKREALAREKDFDAYIDEIDDIIEPFGNPTLEKSTTCLRRMARDLTEPRMIDRKKVNLLRAALPGLRRHGHERLCNVRYVAADSRCTCGADDHNAKIDALLESTK